MRPELAAPSVASDNAKQLASFSNRIGRSRHCERSRSSGFPFRTVLFEFLIRPVPRDIAPARADSNTSLLGKLRFDFLYQIADGVEDLKIVSCWIAILRRQSSRPVLSMAMASIFVPPRFNSNPHHVSPK